MGLALAMTVPLMYYLYTQSTRFYVRWGLVAAMLLTSIAAFGTQSRAHCSACRRWERCFGGKAGRNS